MKNTRKLIELILKSIKESDTNVPIRKLQIERTSRANKTVNQSIYREILFLVLTALERDRIDLGLLLIFFLFLFSFFFFEY